MYNLEDKVIHKDASESINGILKEIGWYLMKLENLKAREEVDIEKANKIKREIEEGMATLKEIKESKSGGDLPKKSAKVLLEALKSSVEALQNKA